MVQLWGPWVPCPISGPVQVEWTHLHDVHRRPGLKALDDNHSRATFMLLRVVMTDSLRARAVAP